MLVFKKIPEELDLFDGDLIIAVVGEDERPLKATNAWLDWRLYGTLSELLVKGVFSGQLGEKCLIPTYGKFSFDRLVLLGGGNLFDDSVYPSIEAGQSRWNIIADHINEVVASLKVQKVGLSLPRFDLADHERALIRTLQASHLPSSTSIFLSRAASYTSAIGF